ncbi:Cytochrome c oxidase subunit 2 [Spatholobus suberectus]|nr:Cytochrome c oxidase subunit 2 [Spatholobus suberectus]
MVARSKCSTTSARIRMPIIGSEGFMCSTYLSIAKRNSRSIHFNTKNSCFTTLVNPEQIVPNSGIHNITTEMVKTLGISRWNPIAPCDAAEPWQFGFQDAATPMMQAIIDLHHDIFFFLASDFGFRIMDLGSRFMAFQL